MHRRQFLRLSTFASLALAGCTGAIAPGGGASGAGVLEVARGNNGGAFLRAVEAAGLAEQLSGPGPLTLFVPTDAAVRAARLPSDRAALRRVLAYHVVPGQVTSSFMTGIDMNHLTSSGATLNVDGRGSGIRVNAANVVRADLAASNGVVHLIDRVLVPG